MAVFCEGNELKLLLCVGAAPILRCVAEHMPNIPVAESSTRDAIDREPSLEFFLDEFEPYVFSVETFRQKVVEWFFAAKCLRSFEDQRLGNESVDSNDLAEHRVACETLVAFGKFASAFARGNEIDLSSIGTDVESISARTRLLEDRFVMFHDTRMTTEEAERKLQELFS
jgi:hypothetical protein